MVSPSNQINRLHGYDTVMAYTSMLEMDAVSEQSAVPPTAPSSPRRRPRSRSHVLIDILPTRHKRHSPPPKT